MKKKTLTYIGLDRWSRPVYQDENGRLWKDIDNRLGWLGYRNENICSVARNEFEGEPDCSMENSIIIDFVPERIIERK